jgi:hypothetical protein
MALIKYTCPPQSATGDGTFSDDLVGFQLVQGGGLTQGNFEFTTSITEKNNRTFNTGNFSEPINLDGLGVSSVAQSKLIFENNFKVYPNFDLTQVTNFTQYGSMVKRISTSVETIISKFPAALEVTLMDENYVTGETASNVTYICSDDETSFELNVSRIRNPFDVDFTVNATRNLQLREVQVSVLRNMTMQYAKYSLYYNNNGFDVVAIVPTTSLSSGVLKIYVKGNPFSGQSMTYDDLVIRPNDSEVNQVFNESLDEVQRFLLNRNVVPKYTATFQVPADADDGTYYVLNQNVTWPLYGNWNLDIITPSFTNYLTTLNGLSESFDLYKTNLISRFLTTGAFKDFDTIGQKMESVLQIYGRSFDETKKFIDALAYMNSVNYNVGNDIPSQLLKNLAQTLGWNTNISPITNDEFLTSVFGEKNKNVPEFEGSSDQQTPDELNYQYYKNLILNSAYLFKSKGTRKSVEILLRLIGAPDALVDFNEYIYLADQRISVSDFNSSYAAISGGTYVKNVSTTDVGNTFRFQGVEYIRFTSTTIIKDVNVSLSEYPIDSEGYPSTPPNTEDYYYEKGSGWFESTPQHRAPEEVNLTNSVFVGSNPDYQTTLSPYTYGQEYLDRFIKFPFMPLGYNITQTIDNNKSWVDNEIGLRQNLDGNYNARYYTGSDKLVLNAKNTDLFLNPGQGLLYDVWVMSRQFNFPIPNEGLNYVKPTYCIPNTESIYPDRSGVDNTVINPQPKNKTFFEFAQTFWLNTINVRNRQYVTDGKTMGYPTLESIYWKYLESEKLVGLENNNFNYQTMIQYVNGLGDYWVRLVEQMIPATTIWNTGVRYENSIFHRQKFVWRRQGGSNFIPVLCRPCSLTSNIFTYDCPIQSVSCDAYPDDTFGVVLSNTLNTYLSTTNANLGTTYELDDCLYENLKSVWYVEMRLNGDDIIKDPFFVGSGLTTSMSVPSNSVWTVALVNSLKSLLNYGYAYYFSRNNIIVEDGGQFNQIVVYNTICSVNSTDVNFELNVGINFEILCN